MKTSKLKVTKKTKMYELLQKIPEAAELLFEKGMMCIGCPAASQETIEQGCLAHGLNPDEIIKEINEKLKNKGKKK